MCKMRLLRALIGSRHATASPAAVHAELFTGRVCLTRWDNACPTRNFNRRDQRADCCVPRAARRPVSLSTTPVPLRKTARSSRAAMVLAATAAGFRLRLGGGVALRLRSRRLSACASLPPLADRRPKPCHIASAIDAGKFQAHTSPIMANRKRKPSRVKE